MHIKLKINNYISTYSRDKKKINKTIKRNYQINSVRLNVFTPTRAHPYCHLVCGIPIQLHLKVCNTSVELLFAFVGFCVDEQKQQQQ